MTPVIRSQCDAADGTTNQPPASASLQRVYDNQILTHKTSINLHRKVYGIKHFYVSKTSQKLKQIYRNVTVILCRFYTREKINDVNHYIPTQRGTSKPPVELYCFDPCFLLQYSGPSPAAFGDVACTAMLPAHMVESGGLL